MVGVVLFTLTPTLWIPAYAGMTVCWCWLAFTLTLVLSHQGRGGLDVVLSCVAPPPPLWIADQVRNDVTMRCIVFTLAFDSSPIKGEGDDGWCCLVVCPALWILA